MLGDLFLGKSSFLMIKSNYEDFYIKTKRGNFFPLKNERKDSSWKFSILKVMMLKENK